LGEAGGTGFLRWARPADRAGEQERNEGEKEGADCSSVSASVALGGLAQGCHNGVDGVASSATSEVSGRLTGHAGRLAAP
jgi:hypothetical protein